MQATVFASASVRHDAGEAFEACVEADELVTRSVVDNELGVLHRIVFEMPGTGASEAHVDDFRCAARISAVVARLNRQSIALCKEWISRFRDSGAQVGVALY